MEIFFVGSNFARLAQGVLLTLQIALVSIVLATLGGLLLGFVMSAKTSLCAGCVDSILNVCGLSLSLRGFSSSFLVFHNFLILI